MNVGTEWAWEWKNENHKSLKNSKKSFWGSFLYEIENCYKLCQ